MTETWTLPMATTSYTVALCEDRRWAELVAWGQHGVEHGPSALANHGRVHFSTDVDAAPVEYAPRGLRPFAGADLVVGRAGERRESWWRFAAATTTGAGLRLSFVDDELGLRVALCYRVHAGTDVLLRWVELTNEAAVPLEVERLGSAGVCLPTGRGARLTFLSGQWAQEFTRREVMLPAGRFRIGSRFGVPGHSYAPWLAVADAGDDGQVWGVSLAWSGSWEIDAEVEASGLTRVRAGRLPHPGPLVLAPGERLVAPEVALASSVDGLDGLARAWHGYERDLAGGRRRRPVLYNSWEATGFAVDSQRQLELAQVAAEVGVELFVVDDGWFAGRDDDTGGLGDWTPDPVAFPDGFGAFVAEVTALGLDFGLWVEPESVSPRSRLYAEHPDWVYRIDGRPPTLVRNQLLLDLGREDVFRFVLSTLDGLLAEHPISYLKWDLNRPATERDRPGAGPVDLDAAHVANYHRVLDHLRQAHPAVMIEACAGGGARGDLATIARADVVWPSDNTGPLDRLAVQDGFLLAHAPHLMSSWVTDAPGLFDTRPRSLRFRFVTAMAGVLGIGADVSAWTAAERAEAAELVARYKEIRDVLHWGETHRLAGIDSPTAARQYLAGATVVVLAWSIGPTVGIPDVPGRPDRIRLRALDPDASYVDRKTGARYSGAHLHHVGLPCLWTRHRDAEVTVLDRDDER